MTKIQFAAFVVAICTIGALLYWFMGRPYLAEQEYRNGISAYSHREFSSARIAFKRSCEMGNGYACNSLGALYLLGRGAQRNNSYAKYYFDVACDMGVDTGCSNYNDLFDQSGQFTPKFCCEP